MKNGSKARRGKEKAGSGTLEGTGPPPAARPEEARLNARVDATFARCATGEKAACDEFLVALLGLRAALLKKFQGRSRRRWHDAEDALHDAAVECYEQALAGELEQPPKGWFTFLLWQIRQDLWLFRRREAVIVDGDAGGEAIRAKEADERSAPERPLELREDAEKMAQQLQQMLSPKQFAVFVARAQGAEYEQIARKLGTTPGAARVHEAKAKEKLRKWRKASKVA